jgi:hypothetical protein
MKAAAVGARTAASPAPAAGLLCAGCAKGLPKAGYSGAQLKRKAKRRCKACVTGGVQLGLQPAAAGSGQLDIDQGQLNQMLGALALTSASSLQQRGGSGGGGGEKEEEVEEVREKRGSPLQTGLPELQAQLDAWCGALDRVDGLEAGGAGWREAVRGFAATFVPLDLKAGDEAHCGSIQKGPDRRSSVVLYAWLGAARRALSSPLCWRFPAGAVAEGLAGDPAWFASLASEVRIDEASAAISAPHYPHPFLIYIEHPYAMLANVGTTCWELQWKFSQSVPGEWCR